jgi:cobalamin synthase
MRPFLTAIRTPESAIFAPLLGALIGTMGGAVYWLAAQVWPSNVAVILSMSVTALLTLRIRSTALFYVLIKYNALMALSAAKLPFAVAPNIALGLIMICGHAASFALMVSVMSIRPEKSRLKVSGSSLGVALLVGFAPAALLGIPGLFGLAGAVLVGMVFIAYLTLKQAASSSETLDRVQLLTEVCFYLGALATWRYV